MLTSMANKDGAVDIHRLRFRYCRELVQSMEGIERGTLSGAA